MTTFDEYLQLGLDQEMHGWDFAWLNQRTVEEPLPWDYRAVVLERMRGVQSMLDLGTGGGELFASLAPLPPVAVATEAYPPNVPLARARLEPLGVRVVEAWSDDDPLPFENDSFALVIDRHSGALAKELFRILKPGGRYITQQVGGENSMDLNRFLEEKPTYLYQQETLAGTVSALESAGLTVERAEEAFPKWSFLDVAGVVFYLKVISWQIPDFTVEKYRDGLYRIHQIIETQGAYTIHEHRYLIEAVKKPST